MARITIITNEGSEVVHELTDEIITIGRTEDNMVQIDHPSVSSHHAQLSLVGGDYHLKDLNSTNGTRVNGQPVSDSQLRGGDRIRLGRVEALYLSGREAEDLKPLPDAPRPEAQIGSGTYRPVDFKSSSPFPRRTTKKDPLSTAIIGVTILSFLLCAGAIASILLLSPPTIPG